MLTDTSTLMPTGEPEAATTWSNDDTGSPPVDRELERELVRAALFDGCSAPKIGRFAVGEWLGAGASSVVYAAWDDRLARRVALKIFVAEASASHQQVQCEACALAQLSHRNVVVVYEVGEWRGHAFIAMELIAGTTLARWQTAARRSTAELLDAYLQAGRGLAAAHEAGLVHRDFKPANVMVAGDGRVVVTDFGLAGSVAPEPAASGARDAVERSASTTRPSIGTPAYAAPEQCRGATPHPSADIYSFAVALCEALIGWHPMRESEVVWRRALARQVPRRLYEAICAGLTKQPAARGDTMAPLLAVLASPPRRRGVAFAIAGLAATTAVIGITHQISGGSPPPLPRTSSRPSFDAEPLHAAVRKAGGFIAAPPPNDDCQAAAALRAPLLAPLPTELRCNWPAQLVGVSLGDDHRFGRNDQGRIYTCALDRGMVSLVTTGARCIVARRGGTIGTIDGDERVRISPPAR